MNHKEAWAERNAIWKASQEEKDRQLKERQRIDARMVSLREACPHEEVHFFSGSPYDSPGYACEVCGKEFNDKPPHARVT